MKFQCDRCKTRYSIADDKVRGKILKIRCKSCEAIITVRDDGAAQAPPPSPQAAAVAPLAPANGGQRVNRALKHTVQLTGQVSGPTSGQSTGPLGGHLATMSGSMLPAAIQSAEENPAVGRAEGTNPARGAIGNPEEWFLSVDGEQEGPLSPEEAQRRVSRKSPNVEMFAWRDDFDEWLPVEEVPVLAVHLSKSPRRRPSIPPLGAVARGSELSASRVARAPSSQSPAPVAADGAPLPPPGDTFVQDDPFAGVPGAQPTAETPPPDDNMDFNIGEASRLVKLPILAPPASQPACGDGLPGLRKAAGKAGASAGGDARADASLKLEIASLSSEMQQMNEASLPHETSPPANERPSETAPPVAVRRRRRLGLPIMAAGGAALGLLVVIVVLVASKSGSEEHPRSEGNPTENVLVTNFYSKDNPLFSKDGPKGAPGASETPGAPAAAGAAEAAKPRVPAVGFPRPRAVTGDGREPQVHLDPVTRPATTTIGPPKDKVDSFGDEGPVLSGPLTPDDVRNTYAANEVGLKRCYERSLKSDPASNVTKMVVKITILPTGGVTDITVPDRNSDLGSCVANSIRAWRFRRSAGEFTTEFTVFFAKRG